MDGLNARAQAALKSQNYLQASQLYAELYAKKPSFRHNYQLMESLYLAQEYAQAFEISQERLQDYLADNEFLPRFLKVAVAAQRNLWLDILFASLKPYLTATEESMWQKTVARSRGEFSASYQSQHTTVMKQLQYLGAEDIFEQRASLQAAQKLTGSEFIEATKGALSDCNVATLVRIEILRSLVELQSKQSVKFLTVTGGESELLPAELPMLEEISDYQALAQQIQSRLSQKGQNYLWQILNLKLLLLWPEIVQQKITWLDQVEKALAILLPEKEKIQMESDLKLALLLEKTLTEWEK